MSPDGTNVTAFQGAATMPQSYDDIPIGEFQPTRWGGWTKTHENVKCPETGKILECQKDILVGLQDSLSLQIHEGREEIYSCVQGTTHVCVNGEVFALQKGDEVFLPRGALHFSWNEGNDQAVFHEIQSGPHCDEADIKRSADKYKQQNEMDDHKEVLQMMIDVCKDRFDAGETATYDFNSSNPNMERIANSDLLNIYTTYKDDIQTLISKMNDVLQKCKNQHADLTPNPKSQPQKACAVK